MSDAHTIGRTHTGVVYEDDGQIGKFHRVPAYDKHRPRIEIEVSVVR